MRPIRKYGMLFLLSAFCAVGFSQNQEIDSLKRQLRERVNIDETYIDILNELSFEYAKTTPKQASVTIEKSIQLSDSIQYKKGKYWATINKGSLFWVKAIYDESLKHYLAALKMDYEEQMGEYIIYNNIGEVFKKELQYDSAHKYLKKALATASEIEGIHPSTLLSNIAELFLLENRIDSATVYFNKSSEMAIIDGSKRGLSYSMFGLAEIKAKKNQLIEAIDLHKQALQLREEITDSRAIVQSLLKLAEYCHLINRREQAMMAVSRAKEIATQFEAGDLLLETYQLEASLYSAAGEFQSASMALQNYVDLEKKMDDEREQNMVEYVISSLQAEISEKENELHKGQIKMQQRTLQSQLWLIIAITVTLIVMLAFLQQYLKRIKLTRQSNEELKKLNSVIINKSEEISNINKSLDKEVRSKTEDLFKTNERLRANKAELSKNLEQKNIITNQLLRSNKMLTDSQKVTKLGSWDYNVVTREMSFTDETYRQLGIRPGAAKPSLELLEKHTSKADYNKIRDAIENIKVTKMPQSVQIVLEKTSSEPRTIQIKMVPEIIEGSFLRVYGSNLDITESIAMDTREKEIAELLLTLSNQSNLVETDFSSFVEQLLIESSQILRVCRASYWQFNQTTNSIECLRLYNGKLMTFSRGYVLSSDEYPRYFEALHNSRTIDANNAATDSRTSEFSNGYLKEFDIKSMLDAQIQIDNQLKGVLCYEQTTTCREWTHSDRRFVGSLVDVIGNALSSYRNQCLTKEKEELIKRLSHQNQNLEEFAYVTSHNLRGPTAQILGLINLLEITSDGETKEQLLTCLNESGRALDQVIKDLGTVLFYQEIDQEEMTKVSLSSCMENVMEKLDEMLPDHEKVVELNFKKGFSILTYEQYLTNILTSIFSNSIKFSKPGKKAVIHFNAYEISDRIIFEFEDNGLGIDLVKFNDKLFKMYQRFHLNIEGKGIGLFIVKNQVELLGGKISIESTINVGTKITIVLPKKFEAVWSKEAIPI